jgi:Tat protein translocase TatB subunit
MIDLGLTKIALIGAVALVVIGPEKLPAVARMAGTLWGRAQRYMNTVKAEVNREMQMEELNKMHSGFMNATSKINQTVTQSFSEVQQNFTQATAKPFEYLPMKIWLPSGEISGRKNCHKLLHCRSGSNDRQVARRV